MSVTNHSDDTKKAIRDSIRATRERHSRLQCKVYQVKIVDSKLTNMKREKITKCFLEAKWLKNHVLATDSIFTAKSSIKTVGVKLPDGSIENRELSVLGSHMKDSLISSMRSNVKGLSSSKKQGRRIGKLRFTKKVSSIPLKEYGNTYKIDVVKQRVFVQKIGWLRVRGLNNIPAGAEYANAVLVDKADGVYIHITTYTPKTPRQYVAGSRVGLDMGLKTSLTLSTGEKFNLYVEEPDRLKQLRKKLSRQQKGSNNYRKTLNKINKLTLTMSRKKQDMAHKFVSDLSHYEHVFFQDEMLSSWARKTGYVKAGRKIQHGVLGRVKELLKQKDWATMLPASAPTTQLCECGVKNKHQLDQRTYFCSSCGYQQDRDIHAAQNMIRLVTSDKRYKKPTPLGQGDVPAEDETAAIHCNFIAGIVSFRPVKQETNPSLVGW